MPGPNAHPLPWWKRLLSSGDTPRRPAAAPAVASAHAPLTALLAPEGIVVWPEPVPRADVVRVLVDRVAGVPGVSADDALRGIWQRDALGSTAIGEGVDLPHARIAGLPAPVFAIALTRGGLLRDTAGSEGTTDAGVADTGVGDDTEIVWLLLLPPGGAGLRPTAQVARACRDRGFREAVRAATGPDDVRAALARWEAAHEAPVGSWST